MNKNSKIYVAGHLGLVGSSLLRKLNAEGFNNLIVRTHKELDLTDQNKVDNFFEEEKPEYIFLAAAKVGGIMANVSCPADFIRINILIQTNTIDAAYRYGTKKLLFLGSSCIYPKNAPQPVKEEYLLTDIFEPTNDSYAIAKIAGIKMIQAYNKQYGFNGISLMPTNLYGPGDNYNLKTSHVLPALIRKIHEAKINDKPEVVLWGTGKPLREFLHVDDLADAAFLLMEKYNSPDIINVGSGEDLSIGELAKLIQDIVDYKGEIVFDTSFPDGTFRKVLDISRLKAEGWEQKIGLREGIISTYKHFLENYKF